MEQIEASTTELRQADATAATDATKGYALSPRFDADGALLGWVVAMSRRGRHILRVFLVTRHGGAEAARAAALAFRDATMQAFAPISKREFGTIVRSNNTSGIPGVHDASNSITCTGPPSCTCQADGRASVPFR